MTNPRRTGILPVHAWTRCPYYFEQLSLVVIICLGVLLPVALLPSRPFHHDEAVYAYWALLISSGTDVGLDTVPLDKPPFFIYTVALFFYTFGTSSTIARLPSLLATGITIGLTFKLAKILYDASTGLIASLIVAISPFSILFAPTALTDPMMVMFVLLASVMASQKLPILSGLALGLAIATKQQGLFFLPLVLALFFIPTRINGQTREVFKNLSCLDYKSLSFWTLLLRFLSVLAISVLIPIIWDLTRSYQSSFLGQSSASYGGIQFDPISFVPRLAGFGHLLELMTASSLLNLIFIIGLPILLMRGILFDWLLTGFSMGFLTLHSLFTFQIWDRYLLGMLPILGLLFARILLLACRATDKKGFRKPFLSKFIFVVIIFIFIISQMIIPIRTALHGGYQIGGDLGAYYGTEEIAAYLRGNVRANVTLYHYWLGNHWRFFLFDFPYDLRHWETVADLVEKADTNRHGEQYIAFPSWQSTTNVELALSNVNLILRPIMGTTRPDGTPAIYIYRIIRHDK
ncbi:MAG: hypothetical protein B6242_03430 [Anaerolineaceae bacterium 4572_78]|nr:MAG: hypothetical protein B6242_03430 [Anaerolineaceae bacterium 4572_78]